jgi:hypothetical protein
MLSVYIAVTIECSQPRHFAITVAVRVGNGPIALKAELIEETQ